MSAWRLEDLAMFAKADKRPKWKQKGWVGPGGAWETAKRKAKEQGKPESYARAIYNKMVGKSLPSQTRTSSMLPYLDEYLEKAGFGSHGGRVIGFIRSSKPIYQSSQLAGSAALHARMSAKGRGHETAASHHSQHFAGHSEDDHNEAAGAHKEAGAAASARGNHAAARHHDHMSAMHADMANHVAAGGGARKPRMASGRPSMAA